MPACIRKTSYKPPFPLQLLPLSNPRQSPRMRRAIRIRGFYQPCEPTFEQGKKDQRNEQHQNKYSENKIHGDKGAHCFRPICMDGSKLPPIYTQYKKPAAQAFCIVRIGRRWYKPPRTKRFPQFVFFSGEHTQILKMPM